MEAATLTTTSLRTPTTVPSTAESAHQLVSVATPRLATSVDSPRVTQPSTPDPMEATTKVALLATATLEAAMAAALVALALLAALQVADVVALVASVDMAIPEASVAVVASEADLLAAELSVVAVPVVLEALVAVVASVLVLEALVADLALRRPLADKDSVALEAPDPDTELPVAREDGEEYLS